ncbi:Rtt107 protein [Maudiozyma humilis]|uniref:Rtt107 protein n=1 Tax=Maudiozyma humilis TaxID=51915 RepID=A0AAV5SBE2_MAUHU|nr:Rtt107 protein [Kazachstania humilis]
MLKRHIRINEYSPDPRHVLKDTLIFVSKHFMSGQAEYLLYTELISALGGTCVDIITSKTTHVVAVSEDDPMVSVVWKKVKNMDTQMKFVFPTWLIECFKQCANVSSEPHLIELQEEDLNQDKLSNQWERVMDMAFRDFESNSAFLKDKTFLIGIDLSLPPNTYQFVQQLIKNYGGKIYHQLNTSDVLNNAALYSCFLGYTAKSKEYDLLSSPSNEEKLHDKNAGNLIWLFTMWSQNNFVESRMSSGKIIFAPFASKIFQRTSFLVSFTNYFGQQRRYVQRLIKLLGGASSTKLTPETTHLIARVPIGRKYDTAKQRGSCIVVNHLWLEDCYKSSSKIDPNQEKYQQYNDVRSDLTLSFGQMSFGNSVAENDSLTNSLQTQEHVTTNHTTIEPFGEKSNNSSENQPTIQTSPDKLASNMVASNTKPTATITTTSGSNDKVKINETDTSPNETFFEASDILDKSLVGKRDIKNVQNDEIKLSAPPIDVSKLFEGISSDEEKEGSVSSTGGSTTAVPSTRKDLSEVGELQPAKLDTTKNSIRQSSNLTSIMQRDSSEVSLTGGSRRAAAAQAAKRLHSDMESLNVFEKQNKNKKGKISLLPQEEILIKKNKEAAMEARRILENCDYYKVENNRTVRKHNFNIAAVSTGCSFDDLTDIDRALLDLMGIKLYGEHYIDKEDKINCIVSPKKLRTAKFLKALAFRNLRHAIVPGYIRKLLSTVHKEKPFDFESFENLDEFMTPEVTRELLDKAHKHRKLFERMGLYSINMTDDVRGGTALISSILQEHGIQDVNILSNKTVGDFEAIESNHKEDSELVKPRKIHLDNGNTVCPPRYVLLATKPAQMKKFKNAILENNKGEEYNSILVVNWDWCVERIFSLDVDYSKNKNVLFTSVEDV